MDRLVDLPVRVSAPADVRPGALQVRRTPNGVAETIQPAWSAAAGGWVASVRLTPGAYETSTATVIQGEVTWRAEPVAQNVTVTGDLRQDTLRFRLAPRVPGIIVSARGLPAGATYRYAAISSPVDSINRERLATQADTLVMRSVSRVRIRPASPILDASGHRYQSVIDTIGVVLAADSLVQQVVDYRLATGSVQVRATGLPTGVPAALSLVDERDESVRPIVSDQILTGVSAGRYRLLANPVIVRGERDSSLFVPSTATQSIQVDTGLVPLARSVQYVSRAFSNVGYLAVRILGEPTGPFGIILQESGGGGAPVSRTSAAIALSPATYQVIAPRLRWGGRTWVSPDSGRSVIVRSGALDSVQIRYVGLDGAVVLAITGLPPQAAAATVGLVTGAGLTDTLLVSGDTLRYVAPGSVRISLPPVETATGQYVPEMAQATVPVVAGGVRVHSVAYRVATAPVLADLAIRRVTVTQAVQRSDGTVPLVMGRRALLRVFADATTLQSGNPSIDVTLLRNGAVYASVTLMAEKPLSPASALLTAVGSLDYSYNWVLPDTLVREGMEVRAALRPLGGRADVDPSNDVWRPSIANPQPNVRPLRSLRLVIVPIQASGLVGELPLGGVDSLLAEARQVLPVAQWDVTVRAPMVSAVAVQATTDLTLGLWLDELAALRIADGADSTTYYYGLFPMPPGTRGAFGGAYVGARYAVGGGRRSDGLVTHTFAHEMGHAMGLFHAPCGVSTGRSYPYENGTVGQWGWDAQSRRLLAPSIFDVMSYCAPVGISDFHWEKALAFRSLGESGPSAISARLVSSSAWRFTASVDDAGVRWIGVPSGLSPTLTGVFSGGMTARHARLVDAAGQVVASAAASATSRADTKEARILLAFSFASPMVDQSRALYLEILNERGRVLGRFVLQRSAR